MKINSIIFPSYNSSDGISIDIFISGCARNPKCLDCHNPHLWNFNNGEGVDYNSLTQWLKDKENLYDNIVIMGGEPLDNKDLDILLSKLYGIKPIWLYTSYEINEVSDNIKQYCNFIKTGRYVKELKSDNYLSYDIKLASTNQKILKRGVDYL